MPKPNYYTLAVFGVVCAAIIGAHFAHIDELNKLLISLLGALVPALAPQLIKKGDS